MWEIAVLGGFAAVAWLWLNSLKARERAVDEGERACLRAGLQLLDDTVECISLRPVRNEDGRLVLRRIYKFEFSDSGYSRRAGHVIIVGGEVENLTLEPFAFR
jgi:hypothetical protein